MENKFQTSRMMEGRYNGVDDNISYSIVVYFLLWMNLDINLAVCLLNKHRTSVLVKSIFLI